MHYSSPNYDDNLITLCSGPPLWEEIFSVEAWCMVSETQSVTYVRCWTGHDRVQPCYSLEFTFCGEQMHSSDDAATQRIYGCYSSNG